MTEKCDLEKICRMYHNRTFEYRKDLPCGMTCEHDTRTPKDAPVPWCYPGCKLVSDAIKRATEAENMRVLKTLDEFYDRIKVAHRQDTSNYGEGLLDGIDLSIAEIKK